MITGPSISWDDINRIDPLSHSEPQPKGKFNPLFSVGIGEYLTG